MTQSITSVELRRPPALSRAEVDALNSRFETAHPTEIIEWAVDTFGTGLCLTTSFADTLLVNLSLAVDPDIEVVFLFPWATVFRRFVDAGAGAFLFGEMMVFLGVLFIGWYYCLQRGAFEWD